MKHPEEVLRDVEPGNDQETRNNRRNELNAVRNQIELWLATFDKQRNGGPYRNEMQVVVDQHCNAYDPIR